MSGLIIPKLKNLWVPKHTAHAQAFGMSPAVLGATAGEATPPAGGDWPDAFMSYPLSGPVVLDGVSNQTISYLSFENILRPAKPIFLNNCDNITISRIDTRKCDMGLVYAENSTNITIEYSRCENIGFSRIDQQLNDGWINENDMNFFQLNGCRTIYAHHLKGRYANNEDVFSFYDCYDAVMEDCQWEGAYNDTRPTSDSSRSVYWTSDSGTAAIMGDGPTYGTDMTVRNCTFIEPGQVGLAIACGYRNVFDNCVIMGTAPSALGAALNQPMYCYPAAEGCGGGGDNSLTNCRGWYANGMTGYVTFPNTNTSGSNFNDGTLNVEDYRVTFP